MQEGSRSDKSKRVAVLTGEEGSTSYECKRAAIITGAWDIGVITGARV